jgi:transposase-like protein
VRDSWRVGETCIKVRGQWVYLVRAGDKEGRIGDFLFSFKQAARRNVRQAVLFPANPANDGVQAVRHRDRDHSTDGVSRDRED